MPTEGQRAVEIAEAELGTGESPDGSNRGPCEKYQEVYGWPIGQPWCGCFTGWVYQRVRAGGEEYSDPSTSVICTDKPHVSAQPGALIVDCGTHVTMLRYQVSGSVWACVGGNESNQVSFSSRDITGWALRGAPWIDEGPVAETTTWYYLQDVVAARNLSQRMYYGGWGPGEDGKATRDDTYTRLKTDLGHELRKFKDPDWDGCYLIDNSAYVTEVYGGWSSKASRDQARITLEARLGRQLRPFSEERTPAQGGVPWNCRNLQTP